MNVHRAINPVNAPKKRRTRRPSKESSKEPKVRILFVASEGLPFSKTGGLAAGIQALPKALVAQDHESAGVLPRYRGTQAHDGGIRRLTLPLETRQRVP